MIWYNMIGGGLPILCFTWWRWTFLLSTGGSCTSVITSDLNCTCCGAYIRCFVHKCILIDLTNHLCNHLPTINNIIYMIWYIMIMNTCVNAFSTLRPLRADVSTLLISNSLAMVWAASGVTTRWFLSVKSHLLPTNNNTISRFAIIHNNITTDDISCICGSSMIDHGMDMDRGMVDMMCCGLPWSLSSRIQRGILSNDDCLLQSYTNMAPNAPR